MVARTFSKPAEARQVEARARSRSSAVRIAVVVEARRYVTASQSEPGEIYAIQRTPIGWACSCLGYYHTGICKHIGAVERRAEREGWTFGSIAPIASVDRYMPLDAATDAEAAQAAQAYRLGPQRPARAATAAKAATPAPAAGVVIEVSTVAEYHAAAQAALVAAINRMGSGQ